MLRKHASALFYSQKSVCKPHANQQWWGDVQGLTFSAILGDMLEAVRWPGEPTSAPGSPFRGSRPPKPESPSAKRVRVPVGQIGTSTLAAHPTRQLFLTGQCSGPGPSILSCSLARSSRDDCLMASSFSFLPVPLVSLTCCLVNGRQHTSMLAAA